MKSKWARRLLKILGIVGVIIILVIIINPFPKFVRYQINKSVSDLEVEGVEVENIQNIQVETIPVRLYNYSDIEKPALVYMPGGAFIAGNLETHDNIARYLAKELDVIVISMDYRKAPEDKYPAGLNDAETVLNWVFNNSKTYGIESSNLILMGDSAGGNFCAVLANKYKDRIAGQVLVNPGLDLTENGAGFQNLSMFIEWYLSDTEQAKEENVSPLLAQSFSGLPPTLIITCENDPLKEDGNAYFIKLKEAGVPVTIKDFKGFSHLAHLWAGTSDDTREIREFVVQEISRILE